MMPDSYLIPNQIVCAELLKLKRAWESFPLDLLAIPDLSMTRGGRGCGGLSSISAQIKTSSYKEEARHSGEACPGSVQSGGRNPEPLIFIVISIGKGTGPRFVPRRQK